jgi:hypothetical protein
MEIIRNLKELKNLKEKEFCVDLKVLNIINIRAIAPISENFEENLGVSYENEEDLFALIKEYGYKVEYKNANNIEEMLLVNRNIQKVTGVWVYKDYIFRYFVDFGEGIYLLDDFMLENILISLEYLEYVKGVK